MEEEQQQLDSSGETQENMFGFSAMVSRTKTDRKIGKDLHQWKDVRHNRGESAKVQIKGIC